MHFTNFDWGQKSIGIFSGEFDALFLMFFVRNIAQLSIAFGCCKWCLILRQNRLVNRNKAAFYMLLPVRQMSFRFRVELFGRFLSRKVWLSRLIVFTFTRWLHLSCAHLLYIRSWVSKFIIFCGLITTSSDRIRDIMSRIIFGRKLYQCFRSSHKFIVLLGYVDLGVFMIKCWICLWIFSLSCK